MNKTENKFVGELIKSCNENHDVNINEVINKSKFNNLDWSAMLKTLEENKYVNVLGTSDIHVTPYSFADYVSPKKAALLFVAKLLILTIKNVAIFGFGILSGILTAYLTHMILK